MYFLTFSDVPSGTILFIRDTKFSPDKKIFAKEPKPRNIAEIKIILVNVFFKIYKNLLKIIFQNFLSVINFYMSLILDIFIKKLPDTNHAKLNKNLIQL